MGIDAIFGILFLASSYQHDVEMVAGISFADYQRVCDGIYREAYANCVREHGGANPLGNIGVRTHPYDYLELEIMHRSSIPDKTDNDEPEPAPTFTINFVLPIKGK